MWPKRKKTKTASTHLWTRSGSYVSLCTRCRVDVTFDLWCVKEDGDVWPVFDFHVMFTTSWALAAIKDDHGKMDFILLPHTYAHAPVTPVSADAVGCEDYTEWDYISLYPPHATFDPGWLLFPSAAKSHATTDFIHHETQLKDPNCCIWSH